MSTCLPIVYLLATYLAGQVLVYGQLSRLTLILQHTADPRGQSTSEMLLDDVNINLIQNKICFGGSDATFVLRVNPALGTMDVVAKTLALKSEDKDVHSCKPAYTPVACDADMCQEDCACRVRAVVSCEEDNDVTDWESTEFIDLILQAKNGHLAMAGCLEKCAQVSDKGKASAEEGHSLSDLALGLIVAGAVVLGALLATVLIVWKMRNSRVNAGKFCGKVTCAK